MMWFIFLIMATLDSERDSELLSKLDCHSSEINQHCLFSE